MPVLQTGIERPRAVGHGMSTVNLSIIGPIPHPSTWCLSPDPEPPAGFMRLAGCSITRRPPAKIPASDLVPREDIAVQAMRALFERLLQAFAALDEGGRLEIVKHAEALAPGQGMPGTINR